MGKYDKPFSHPRWNQIIMPISVGEPRELTEKEKNVLEKLEEFAKRDEERMRSKKRQNR